MASGCGCLWICGASAGTGCFTCSHRFLARILLKRINPATAVLYQVAGEEPCESLKQVRTLEASKSSVDQQVWCWEEPFVISRRESCRHSSISIVSVDKEPRGSLKRVRALGSWQKFSNVWKELSETRELETRTEEQPVRASSWNHYRLVDREAGHGGQLPPTKDDVPGKCASFTCFGCTPARLEGASPPKLSSSNTRQQLSSSTSRKGTNNGSSINGSGRKGCLKSNSKRDSSDRGSIVSDEEQPRESLEEVQTLKTGMERRKVHWTDTCGKELFEIREFETSLVFDGMSPKGDYSTFFSPWILSRLKRRLLVLGLVGLLEARSTSKSPTQLSLYVAY
uniref:Uncharacterized protein n=1 Tax=Aegilops tauschii TaxID=37682 RepID=N1QQ34_AEGTA